MGIGMNVTTLNKFSDVKIITPQKFSDQRGFFLELYQQQRYQQEGMAPPCVQANLSSSSAGVIRGLHYQLQCPQDKLVSAVQGAIFDVVVDLRMGSETFGLWAGVELSSENARQIWVPAGFAHGFSVLSEHACVMYQCSDYYNPEDEYGVNWHDSSLGVDWRVASPIVSDKDQALPLLDQIPAHSLPRL